MYYSLEQQFRAIIDQLAQKYTPNLSFKNWAIKDA